LDNRDVARVNRAAREGAYDKETYNGGDENDGKNANSRYSSCG